jgi:hypothetical protein
MNSDALSAASANVNKKSHSTVSASNASRQGYNPFLPSSGNTLPARNNLSQDNNHRNKLLGSNPANNRNNVVERRDREKTHVYSK